MTPIPSTPSIFDEWAGAGFREDLLPIVPVDAEISPGSKIGAGDRGKVPGLRVGDAWSGFPRWTDVIANGEHIQYWGRLAREHGAGVGLQARRFPGVDIDVTDASASDLFAGLADAILGAAPERVGRAPKRLLPYALAPGEEPVRKRRVEFTLPGSTEAHAVEVLGAGQQYVVDGIHPRTRQPYAWGGTGSPVKLGPAGLTPITRAGVDRYIAEVERTIEALGGTILSKSAAADRNEGDVDQDALRADPEKVREAAQVIGNDTDYDEWLKRCAAFKAALGGLEEHYWIFEEWCLLYPGNTPEVARAKWDSLSPPYKVGADYIFRQAVAKGWEGWGAGAWFSPIVEEEEEDAGDPAGSVDAGGGISSADLSDPNIPDFIKRWVYALDQERFIRLADRYAISERQFARLLSTPGIGPDHRANPAKQFFQEPARRLVQTMTYMPGCPPLVRVDGADAVNVWLPAPVEAAATVRATTILDGDVAVWLDHMERLIPDPRARGVVLDWMAYVVQFPMLKPNWAIFLGGAQGIGKDLAILPLIRAIGARNTRTVQPGELASEYTDWVAHKRLVVIEEMRNFETKAVMNKLKLYITRPPERVPVHQKFMPIYEVPNVAAFLFMSNFRDALSLEKDDRRYFVYWSPMIPEPPAYYDRLAKFVTGTGGDEVVAWLYARPLPAFDAAGRAPDSDDKAMMTNAGLNDFEGAIVEAIEAGAAPFNAPVTTIAALWAALPSDTKRLPGASMKRLTGALQIAGGGPIVDRQGVHRRVALDAIGEGCKWGKARLWAPRDPDQFRGFEPETLRTIFRQAHVAGATDTDAFSPIDDASNVVAFPGAAE